MKSSTEILNELNIGFQQRGDNYIIPCPNPHLHNGGVDNHPSCSMRISDGVYKCFSCGSTGNLYTLYKLKTGNNLQGGDNYRNQGYYKAPLSKKVKKGDLELTEGKELSVFKIPKVLTFLESIGVYDKNFIYDFEVKFTRFARYKSKHVDHEKNGTAFVNRLLWPVYDFDGNWINIEGRTIKGDIPKVLYPKGAVSDWIFNLEKCDPTKPLVVVEGIKDLCRVWNVTKNVVSIFGGNWTEEKIRLLKKYGFNDIILFIDNDKAGEDSADQFDSLFDKDFRICHSDIIGGDPNDLTLRAIKYKIDHSDEYGRWLMNKMSLKTNMNQYW